MVTCKDCIHHDLCDEKGHLILTINEICELEYRSDVSKWWCKHFKPTADVAPRSEVAREIFAEIDVCLERFINDISYSSGDLIYDLGELKQKCIGDQK